MKKTTAMKHGDPSVSALFKKIGWKESGSTTGHLCPGPSGMLIHELHVEFVDRPAQIFKDARVAHGVGRHLILSAPIDGALIAAIPLDSVRHVNVRII